MRYPAGISTAGPDDTRNLRVNAIPIEFRTTRQLDTGISSNSQKLPEDDSSIQTSIRVDPAGLQSAADALVRRYQEVGRDPTDTHRHGVRNATTEHGQRSEASDNRIETEPNVANSQQLDESRQISNVMMDTRFELVVAGVPCDLSKRRCTRIIQTVDDRCVLPSDKTRRFSPEAENVRNRMPFQMLPKSTDILQLCRIVTPRVVNPCSHLKSSKT